MKKEACIESLAEAITTYQAGANRLELCSRLDLDGLTPSEDLIRSVLENVPLPIRVMIRTSNAFQFSEEELKKQEQQILFCKKIALENTPGTLEGIVLGFLKNDKTVDVKTTRRLAQLAAPLKVVFHKAIDATPDVLNAAEVLTTIPEITDILTSGGMPTAEEGSEVLNELVEKFGDRLDIISAGKVTPLNVKSLHEKIGGTWYHGRRIV